MNKNDYRRALIMLRSLRAGLSGYVRLERRTLIATLHFTINGAPEDGNLYAVLLYHQNGAWHGVRAGELAAPRYGQTGLIWKFDPRNIEGRTLEQYDLAAIIEIRSGICDLVLCGNLNGSIEVDWAQIRETACRLFTPVRIAGIPVAPIDEQLPPSPPDDESDFVSESISDPVSDSDSSSGSYSNNSSLSAPSPSDDVSYESCEISSEPELSPSESIPDAVSEETNSSSDSAEEFFIEKTKDSPDPSPEETSPDADHSSLPSPSALSPEPEEFDIPAEFTESEIESDEIDTPAEMPAAEELIESDEIDLPAQDDIPSPASLSETTAAGDLLELTDKTAPWPDCISSLKELFFSSEAVYPFEADGYVFVRAPLPESTDPDFCFVGLYCEDGIPARVCYALPAPYTPEPPAGLEGYVWRGDPSHGCWAICEAVAPD